MRAPDITSGSAAPSAYPATVPAKQ
jgi:hypothetical protein